MTETARPRPGRKRSEATRQAILKAAAELLEEHGVGRFTIEGVAARSGAGKTTIYRWWATKGALAVEATLAATETLARVPLGGSAAETLRAHMRLLAEIFDGPAGRVIAGVIAAGQSDRESLAAYTEGILERRRSVSRLILERGIASGEFRPDLRIEGALDALYGPYYTRLLLRFGPFDDAFVDDLLTTVLAGIGKPA